MLSYEAFQFHNGNPWFEWFEHVWTSNSDMHSRWYCIPNLLSDDGQTESLRLGLARAPPASNIFHDNAVHTQSNHAFWPNLRYPFFITWPYQQFATIEANPFPDSLITIPQFRKGLFHSFLKLLVTHLALHFLQLLWRCHDRHWVEALSWSAYERNCKLNMPFLNVFEFYPLHNPYVSLRWLFLLMPQDLEKQLVCCICTWRAWDPDVKSRNQHGSIFQDLQESYCGLNHQFSPGLAPAADWSHWLASRCCCKDCHAETY